MPNNFYLVLLEGEACHIYGGASTHIGEVKYVQFIPNLAKSFLIKWLGEYIIKLIIGANTLNCNVAFHLVISYEMMPYVNVQNRVVGELDCTFIVT